MIWFFHSYVPSIRFSIVLIIPIQRREINEREARIRESTTNHSTVISQSAKSKIPTNGAKSPRYWSTILLKRGKNFWTEPRAYNQEPDFLTLPGLPWNSTSKSNSKARKNGEFCILGPVSNSAYKCSQQESTYNSPAKVALDTEQSTIHSFHNISHWITFPSRSPLYNTRHTFAHSGHRKWSCTTFDNTRTQRSHRGSGGYSPWLCCADPTDFGCIYRPSLGLSCNLHRKPQLDKRWYFRHGRTSDVRIHDFHHPICLVNKLHLGFLFFRGE